jgi:hypothetical protein
MFANSGLVWEAVGLLKARRTEGATFVGPGIMRSSLSNIFLHQLRLDYGESYIAIKHLSLIWKALNPLQIWKVERL